MGNEKEYLDKAIEWLVINGADFAVNFISFLIILIIGKFVINGICNLLQKTIAQASNLSDILNKLIINVCHKVLWVIVAMLALQKIGIDVAPLIAGLGVTGFIVGFAFQESLGNLAAGLMIALNQPFKVGDFVETSGKTGVINDLNMMAITLYTPDNKKIVIPNSQVWGSAITNFTALATRRVDLTVGISYAADIDQAKDVIADTLEKVDKILDEPAPMIEIVEMADSSINFVVRPWSKTEHFWDVFFQLQHDLKLALDKAGIEIPFPQMDIHHHGLPQQKG